MLGEDKEKGRGGDKEKNEKERRVNQFQIVRPERPK
jgi:hypothetical protein